MIIITVIIIINIATNTVVTSIITCKGRLSVKSDATELTAVQTRLWVLGGVGFGFWVVRSVLK